jgi:hypothetical protein
MRAKFSRIREGLADAETAFERARNMAEEAVSLEKVTAGYVGIAIDNLTREGDFGSWLKKLYRGEKVTVHLHYYERLCWILEDRAEKVRRRADHVQAIAAKTRGRDAAAQGNRGISEAARQACAA